VCNALGILHVSSGKWEAAAEQFQRALDEASEHRSQPHEWVIRGNLARALAVLGRSEEAHEQLRLCVVEATAAGWGEPPSVAHILAVIAQRSGDAAGARAMLFALAKRIEGSEAEGTLEDAWVHNDLACLELEFGEVESARQHILRSLRVHSTVFSWSVFCKALAVAATVAESDGRWELAAYLEAGIRSWMDRAGYVIDPIWLEDMLDQSTAEARSPLDPLGFASAWGNGTGRHLIDLAESFIDAQTGSQSPSVG
jgi:tetratricopeptide (TPR) repeat protein